MAATIIPTVPGATGVSEWGVFFNKVIATCVEASESVITGIYGVLPATQATDRTITQQQIAAGLASPSGASNWWDAGQELGTLGIPNTTYGPSQITPSNWVAIVQRALAQGIPVLAGVPRALNLRDSVTGARPDAGVYGHALTIVGEDASGFLVADPNTAPGSGFMHYTADSFNAAGLNSLVVPNSPPQAVQSTGSNPLDVAGNLEQWVSGWAGDVAARVGLFLVALLLIAIALLAFFFGGSGKSAAPAIVKAVAS